MAPINRLQKVDFIIHKKKSFGTCFGISVFQQMFQGMFREFQQQGIRMDHRFFEKMFFGGRGFFVGGFFFFGPFRQGRMGYPSGLGKSGGQHIRFRPIRFLQSVKQLGRKIGQYLSGGETKPLSISQKRVANDDLDLSYSISLNDDELRCGTTLTISVDRGKGTEETLRVHVPPGSRKGNPSSFAG